MKRGRGDETIFVLRDGDGKPQSVRVRANGGFLELSPTGYGHPDEKNGPPVSLDWFDGSLRLLFSPDINDDGDEEVVDLEGARECLRRKEEEVTS